MPFEITKCKYFALFTDTNNTCRLIRGFQSLLENKIAFAATVSYQSAENRMTSGYTVETLSFRFSDVGVVFTFVARWTNHRGEAGPWSDPVSVSIS
jgi:hypothetical protein